VWAARSGSTWSGADAQRGRASQACSASSVRVLRPPVWVAPPVPAPRGRDTKRPAQPAPSAAGSRPLTRLTPRFVQEVVSSRGHPSDEAFDGVREAGYTDEQIMEMIAKVALTTFSNYMKETVEIDMDVPVVETTHSR
jgi:hypothetical protein